MKSKYLGVYWSGSSKKWYVRLHANGKQLYLGTFEDELEAARAYDQKVFELRGDTAKFNLRNNQHSCEADYCKNLAITKFLDKWVCQKHKSQLKQYGKFLVRTAYDSNEIAIQDDLAYIFLYDKHGNKTAEAIIDAFNVDKVSDYKWYLRPDGYVATTNYNGSYKYLHALICDKINKKYVDHKDRNKLNNTEANLREADGSENQMNKGLRANNTSGKAGVHFAKEKNRWCAMICVRGKRTNLGYFATFEEAVEHRLAAEHKYFKAFKAEDECKIFK